MRNYPIFKLIAFLTVAAALAGCRGQPSQQPPIHLNPNMDWQEKFRPMEANPFFEDNRSMRTPVEGTIARGLLRENTGYYEGLNENGSHISRIPVSLDRSFLHRGRERYEIYCTPCHGGTGTGNGIVISYGYVPPPSFNEQRILDMPDGEIYSAIHNGVRTMPSYRHQIPVEDRWAIVAYIRDLQRSQNATQDDLRQLNLSTNGGDGSTNNAD
jgi:hypothetical protein